MNTNRFFYIFATFMVCIALLLVSFGLNFDGLVTKVYSNNKTTEYFQHDEILKVNINISDEQWAELVENAADKEYTSVSVDVNDDHYEYVNFRTKGNSSLRDVISRHGDSETEGSNSSTRFSFKLEFNNVLETQTMGGIIQLNLNNCYSDPSYMREFMSYEIYEEMGLPVPLFCYAAVYINNEYHGLYLAVESILEPYLERNFDNITGDLYKSDGNKLTYTGNIDEDSKSLTAKTDFKNPDLDLLQNMLKVLNEGENIEEVVNVDGALRYIAVTTALANMDSYLGNFGHNYYLYENNGIFSILPWDLNMSFGAFPSSNLNSVFIDEPTQGSVIDRPLVDKLLNNQQNLDLYHQYLTELVNDYLSPEYLNNKMSEITELISEYVKTDPTAFYTYEEFVENTTSTELVEANKESNNGVVNKEKQGKSVPTILGLASHMTTIINNQLSGESPATNDGKGAGMGDRGNVPLDGQEPPDGNQGPPPGDRQGPPPGDRQGPPPGMEGQAPPDGTQGPPPGMEDQTPPEPPEGIEAPSEGIEGQEPPESPEDAVQSPTEGIQEEKQGNNLRQDRNGMQQGKMGPGDQNTPGKNQTSKTQYIVYGILLLVFLGILFWIKKIKTRKL